ncbi:MAG: hypothetical protein HZA51_18250 [Planctomycetes bacterium]|nr:hypothetical protein [Planctomycetota bacterium]
MNEVPESPRDVVSALLDALGITQIVFVDDLFAKRVALSDVQAAQLSLTADNVKAITGKADFNLPNDVDVRRQVFERFWNEQSSDSQQQIGQQLIAAAQETQSVTADDAKATTALTDIVGSNRLKTLSPLEWTTQRDTILESAKTGRTLLLFDQDLRDAQGSSTGGMTLIASVLAVADSASVMCGLLTHTVQMSNERDAWQTLANEHHVDRDRFIVIAKENLRADPLQFARMLKLVALSPDCREMKRCIQQLLVDSVTVAAKEVADLDVFDFEHAVLRVANREGMWEPDMLFRLFEIFQRTELRRRAYDDTALDTVTQRLRKLSNIPTDSPSKSPVSTWRLQQRELYDAGEQINKLHLPIEIGDVFVKTGGGTTKSYILLGQPCDLMVRPNGVRSPDARCVLVGEVTQVEKTTRYDEEIQYFGDDASNKYYVRFKRISAVPILVLDLCVFNADGVSRFVYECPDRVHPAWQQRHEAIKRQVDKLLSEYDSFGSGKANENDLTTLRESLVQMFPPIVGRDGLFKAKIDVTGTQKTLVFDCARVKRLNRARAAALALQYASCFSRPAFGPDLGSV